MNILLIAGRVGSYAWTQGDTVRAVGRELARRGHALSLVCESLDDPARFDFCSRIHAKNPFEQSASDFPPGFAAWALRRARTIAHDASVSFSRAVGADVWMPLDPTPRAWLRGLLDARGVVRSAPALAKHHALVLPLLRSALRSPPPGGARAIIAVGDVSAQGAARAHRGADVRQIEFWAPGLLADHADRTGEHRARVRELLGIAPSRPVVLLSATSRPGPWLDPLLRELAAHGATSTAASAPRPALVVLALEQFPVHERALRAGVDRDVRVIGTTLATRELLDAADALALAAPCPLGPWNAGATGRMAGEALAAGRPLIAHVGCAGAELARRLAPPAPGQPPHPVGLSIDDAPGSWRRAFKQITDEPWRARASAAARTLGATLTLASAVTSIERELIRANTERSPAAR